MRWEIPNVSVKGSRPMNGRPLVSEGDWLNGQTDFTGHAGTWRHRRLILLNAFRVFASVTQRVAVMRETETAEWDYRGVFRPADVSGVHAGCFVCDFNFTASFKVMSFQRQLPSFFLTHEGTLTGFYVNVFIYNCVITFFLNELPSLHWFYLEIIRFTVSNRRYDPRTLATLTNKPAVRCVWGRLCSGSIASRWQI